MADKGWVKIHRSITECGIWKKNEPFDCRSAWVSLILMANHQDREIIINGKPLIVKRGQRFTSIRNLAAEWHWSRDRVSRYLATLHATSMVTLTTTHNGTLITVEKYEHFQSQSDTNKDALKDAHKDTVGTRARPRSRHKQELKNEEELKNERNKSAPRNLSPEGVEYQ